MKSESLTDTLRETLAVFDGSGEPRTTPEVAERLDLGRRSTYNRLERLVDQDRLETKKVGANARVWWDPSSSVDEGRTRRHERERFESLVEAVQEYAIYTLDPNGYVRSWNDGAERIKGYEAEEILGEHFSTFYVEHDRDSGVPERNLEEAVENGSIDDEGWRIRADGERFWANVSLTAITDEDGALEGFTKVTRDMTERRERERTLRRERDLTEHVLETAPVNLGVVDADGEIERLNSRATRQFGSDGSTPETIDDIDVYDAEGSKVTSTAHPITHVLETGESISDWLIQHDGPDGERRWLSVTASPLSHDDAVERVVVAGKDVTDLKLAEQDFKHQRDDLRAELDDVFERISDGFFAVDDEWNLTYLNETTADRLGTPRSELLGEPLWEAFPGLTGTEFEEAYRGAMRTQEPRSAEAFYPPFDGWFQDVAYPSESGLSVYFRDVSERKEHERELERYETIVENVHDGIYVVDQDGYFTLVNDTYAAMVGNSREDLVGSHVSAVIENEAVLEAAQRREAELAAGEKETASVEAELGFVDGEPLVGEATFSLLETETGYERIGSVRDVSDRIDRERQLEQFERIVQTVEDGIYVLDADNRFAFVNDGFTAMTEYDRTELVGAPAETVFGEKFLDIAEETRADLESENRDVAELEERLFRPDGTSFVVENRFSLFDVDEDELGRVGVVRDVTDRIDRERELERQRKQLTALNNLNAVVREVTGAAIDQSTRAEIEATVCNHLADTDSYQFAWIGDADPATQTVELRTEAGVEDFLEGITISVDPDDDRSEGPTGRAFRTGEMQTTHDIEVDARHDPWRSELETYEIRSSAAIPIVHEDTVYGVLNVYADRPRAFAGREGDLLAQLGEIVGHAIVAAERKQALMSDELVELAFQIEDVFGALDVPVPTDGTITLDHAVPIDDDEYLVYGTATPDAIGTVETIVETLPHWDSVSFHAESDPTTFELRLTDPPVLTSVASMGGAVEEAVIEDGDYRMTIHLPPSVDVRRVIDAVETAYPTAEMLRRRQVTRSLEESQGTGHRLVSDLTERQRTALETAHYAGFFEWPRVRSGEDVAASLDIAPPTFHQHLRKAQRKVFESVFSSSRADAA